MLKQRLDDLVPHPSPTLMPLVAATNTAERITHVAIGAPGGASDWVAEIDAFGGHVNAALVALQQWGAPQRYSTRPAGVRQGNYA